MSDEPLAERWNELYASFAEAERARLERADDEARDAECARLTARVMEDVAERARARAAELAARTDTNIAVRYPGHAPVGGLEEGPYMTFLRLELDGREVHLYSHRAPGTMPVLNFVQLAPHDGGRHRRLVSADGAVVVRDGDGYVLERVERGEASTMSADELVLRGFELLLDAFRS